MNYTIMDTMVGPILIAGDDEGLKRIHFQKGEKPEPVEEDWKRNNAPLKNAVEQLKAYFAGELKDFDLKLDPIGTVFQKRVWNALMRISYGQTASYKDIATAVGNPKAVRAVGGANGKNPLPIVIPCHRIMGSNGKIVGYSSGLEIKRRLLELERKHRNDKR